MASDVIVVGAGPCGLIAAKEIASRGFSVKVFEEHQTVGIPSHCAGLISVEGLQRLGVDPDAVFVQNAVNGGIAYSPDGRGIRIEDDKPRAYAVDRAALDRLLAERAAKAGTEIELGMRVEKIVLAKGRATEIAGVGWRESARVVIDAEGASRRLLAGTGLASGWGQGLVGVNTEVQCAVDSSLVEVWLGRELAPGLFAWVIPLSDTKARAGLATKGGDAQDRLDTFVKKRFEGAEHGPIRGGFVLTDGPLKRTAFDGLLLVGDAAGHSKPTTGGGFVMGGLCAMEAAKATCAYLEDSQPATLIAYERVWRKLYGSQFATMSRLRGLADRVGDDRLNRLTAAFADCGEALGELVAEGDMDLQEGAIRRAFTDPRLAVPLTKALGRLALAELRSVLNL